MWIQIFICVIVCVSVGTVNSDEFPVFNKCCSKNMSLIKVYEFNGTDERFECLDREDTENLYNISHAPLVIGEYVRVDYGIPTECEQFQMSTHMIATELEMIPGNRCYDKLVLEAVNDTLKKSVPKIVAITCNLNNTENVVKSKLTVDHVKKCCPAGFSYDVVNHLCRKSDIKYTEDTLIKELKLSEYNIKEVDSGLHCKIHESAVELTEEQYSFKVVADSLIVVNKNTDRKTKIPQGEWCMDHNYQNQRLIARVCTDQCSDFDAYCVKKCCPVGQHYKTLRCGSPISKCVPTTDDVFFDISVYLEPLERENGPIADVLGIRNDIMCPSGKVMLNRSVEHDYHELTPDGFLKSPVSEKSDYCLEAFDSRHCPGGVITITAVTCFVKAPVTKDFRVSFVVISISSVCLALTLIVYCALPELRNLHGRTLICHVGMMLLAFSCLARVQYAHVPNRVTCTLLGYGIYFGFVAAFAWLNVMCFDIWWTFGSVRTVQPLRKAGTERRRFLWYSLYAWSFAIILTLITFLFDTYPVSKILDANIGSGMCWFGAYQNTRTDWPHYIFFVIPMGLVTCTNFVLWIMTARHCARVKSEVHRLQAGSVGDRAKRRFRIDRAKYVLTGKLWVVMGAGWISELLSTLTSEPQWLWMCIDLLNELQGVFIFLILVFKPKLYYLIRKRLGLEKPDAQKNGPSSSGRTSSTFLSRTISSDERTNMRISQLNNAKQA
ncbi:probable G-protein coupled receptor Mth-like 3 isoform X2 [Manduca sexta]|uniref:probable G-protein coupled receptor Mth-like 3 isoform X2 n=1 Tax=Manduca sexta TaxID=7130 RepID=UPI0011831AB5|nr:probable G-protein coupled receptor Mth-like 3 isoform X2 [Manduca sexta]